MFKPRIFFSQLFLFFSNFLKLSAQLVRLSGQSFELFFDFESLLFHQLFLNFDSLDLKSIEVKTFWPIFLLNLKMVNNIKDKIYNQIIYKKLGLKVDILTIFNGFHPFCLKIHRCMLMLKKDWENCFLGGLLFFLIRKISPFWYSYKKLIKLFLIVSLNSKKRHLHPEIVLATDVKGFSSVSDV